MPSALALAPDPDDRAYAIWHIKAIDAERRVISGIATTPEPDRVGDVIEPTGISFTNPLPLLLHHDRTKPVGRVVFQPPTAAGVLFEASLPFVDEPGIVKDRVDEAWHSIKAGLLAGVSIGYQAGVKDVQTLASGGRRFLKTLVYELSLVTVPANAQATILAVKELDRAALSGLPLPAVAGASPTLRASKGAPAMLPIQDQITQFENTRAARAARMADVQKQAEGRTKDEAERTEFQTLEKEIESIDAELVDLRKMEKLQLVKAAPVAAPVAVTPAPLIHVKSMLPPGTAFTRFIMATAVGKGDYMRTLEHAKQWESSSPEVLQLVKAAVAAGNTTDAAWAGPLAGVTTSVTEFLDLLRPKTILGRVAGFRKVPFNTKVNSQTGGGTYQWVGQGLPKPVTAAAFSAVTLTFAKAAGIIVLTEELVKLSSPSAEQTVRDEMIAGIAQFLDGQFITPGVAAVANVSPASITNGAPTAAASGVTGTAARTDLAAAVGAFAAAGIPLADSVWIMSDANAFGLSMAMNGLGQPLFPGVTMDGGTLFGRPVIISNTAAALVVLVHAPSILYADDGGVTVDVSREASVQMDSNPDGPTVATTVLVSLWQNNLVGLRAERFITWLRARTAAVRVITGAAYTG